MRRLDSRSLASLILLLTVIGAGCSTERSGAGRSPQGPTVGDSGRPAGTVKILWSIEPDNFHPKIGAAGPMSSYHWIFNSVLTHRDTNGVIQKMIARDLPRIALLYYNPGVLIAKNRLQGPIGETAESGGISWNIHEGTLRD